MMTRIRYTFANPPQCLRDDYDDGTVPWHKYPAPPDALPPGPALIREFHRSWSDSSTQDSYDTAATILAEDTEFFATHPWLTTPLGSMSDGASNYSSTSSLVYSLLNKHWTVKCTSVEGMGKDGVDANNGREQPILAQARASSDLTYTKEYVHACNARRPPGNVNACVEPNREHAMTADEKKRMKAIDGIVAMKLRARLPRCSKQPLAGVILWELFSKRLSERAGYAVGYGRGRTILTQTLKERHQLAAHRLPADSAKLSFVATDALAEGEDVRHNPVGLLSKKQKADAATIADAMKSSKADEKKARAVASAAKVAATYNSNVIICPVCARRFKKQVWYDRHQRNNCGLGAAAVNRRRVHDASTVRALVKLRDDDLADLAEAEQEAGLDLIKPEFTSSDFGWELSADVRSSSGVLLPPAEFASLVWTSVSHIREAPALSRVRISATHFETTAPGDFGPDWRSAFYYGQVVSVNAARSCVNVLWSGDDEPYQSHVQHIEVGSDSDVPVEPRAAVVKRRALGGAAHRNHVHVGCVIISVNSIETPTLDAVTRALAQASPSKEQPLRVVLRRPSPQPKSWRGQARSEAHSIPPTDWHPSVVSFFDELMKDPRLERRSNRVYEQLQLQFGTSLDSDGKCMLPTRDAVEKKMLRVFKNKREQQRKEAQDSAARALAREVANGNAEEEGEIVVSDDDDDEPGDPGPEDDDGSDGAAGGGSEDTAQPSDEIVHFDALAGVNVTVLRQRLRDSGEAALATVKQSDLPPGTPESGNAKSEAVKRLLRERLARALARGASTA